ncbi:hypothetical protein N7507_006089 [Penicillium longicatenatum]|nr:hypothetical protein N7507_006089 [Penicillium longicatenatum]
MSYSRGDRGSSRGESRGGSRGSGGSGYRGDSRGRGDRGGSRGDSRGGGGGGGYRGPGPVNADILTTNPPELNKELHRFEDQCLKEVPIESGLEKPVRRPAYGKLGKLITVRANFFEISLDPKREFHSYRIAISPEPQPKRLKKDVFDQLLKHERIAAVYGSSDMAQELITSAPLDSMSSIKINLPDGNKKEPKVYIVKITKADPKDGIVHHFSQGCLSDSLKTTKQKYPVEQETVAVRGLNIMMTRIPYRDSGVVITGKGRQKFFWIDNRKQFAYLGGGLEVLRGFFASVRVGVDKLLLNVNVNHGTFFRPGPMLDLTNGFMQEYGEDRQLFNRYIRGLRVEVSHLPLDKDENGVEKRRQKSIWGIASPNDGKKGDKFKPRVKNLGSSPANVEFWETDSDGKGGKYTSVKDYFKKAYKMDIKESKPVLNVGNSERPIYLPQEVCKILPGQTFNGDLCTSQRQAIIKFCCRRPPDNFASIMRDGLEILGIKDQKLKSAGVKIGNEMVAVPARVLPPPTLKYGTKTTTPRGASWNLRDVKFTQTPPKPSWAVITLANTNKVNKRTEEDWERRGEPQKAIKELERCLKELGFAWDSPNEHRVFRYNSQNCLDIIEGLMKKCKEHRVKFVVVLMSDGEEKAFNHLKWAGDCTHGILTHCCKMDKFTSGDKQYLANNAMKINLKLGGICQVLDSHKNALLIAEGNTMVVGLDVTHPSANDPESCPSVSSIVASTDRKLGQWPGEIRVQGRRDEVILQVGTMLEGRLRRWKKENKEYPKNILIYRDGVSEGQYAIMIRDEISSIRKECGRVYDEVGQKPPRISYVVVGKRHHVRFFPTSKDDLDKNNNPNPGTVVDRGITRPVLWDFYLQAQAAIMGSARPAHYIVMEDEIFGSNVKGLTGNPMNDLQEITHSICYVMGRCTRSVSYCTPAFLADRFCDRARKYVLAHYTKWNEVKGFKDPDAPAPTLAQLRLHDRTSEYMVYI